MYKLCEHEQLSTDMFNFVLDIKIIGKIGISTHLYLCHTLHNYSTRTYHTTGKF